jgi:hypothetical protein
LALKAKEELLVPCTYFSDGVALIQGNGVRSSFEINLQKVPLESLDWPGPWTRPLRKLSSTPEMDTLDPIVRTASEVTFSQSSN